MTEKEKMLGGECYSADDPELMRELVESHLAKCVISNKA